ncbi:MAG: pseudouridine synthase [Deltaproteobacteria bacterium]|jgi:pseudouridine synthase|nr:pseudouridine synthase [Deltaproteobacteria bacterium]
MEERLHKALARLGIASRRHAEDLIRQGRVTVNGRIVTAMGIKVDTEKDMILIDGRPLPPPAPLIYALLNKPKGFVTTLRDPQKRPIVTDLLKDISVRVCPVGRLDYDTEGLLLLTNDGDLSFKLQHPRFKASKTYEAEVKGRPAKQAIDYLRNGVIIEGRKTQPALAKCLRKGENSSLLEITIREGRKRQIKKMCAAVGHPVLNLRRTAFADLKLGHLAPGQYRLLHPEEVGKLKNYITLQTQGRQDAKNG